MRIRLIVALTVACSTLFGPAAAQAAPTVSNTNDSGAGSLRQAIAEAAPGDTITVPAGDYQVSSKSLEIQKSLTLAGAASNATVIRSTGPFRVFAIGPPGSEQLSVTLAGMTIRDGREFAEAALGAGVAAIKTDLTLRNAIVTGNLANSNGELAGEKGGSAFGAGVVMIEGVLSVLESKVEGNTAEAVGGPAAEGGIAQGAGVLVISGSFVVETSAISGNVVKASGGQGPANAAQDGGIAVAGGIGTTAPDVPSKIVASTISDNVAEAPAGPGGDGSGFVGGAGLYTGSENGIPVTITSSTIAQNVSRNGTVAGPKPAYGGGVVAISDSPGAIVLTGVTIAANRLESASPTAFGGNVVFGGLAGAISIRDSIVANGVGPAGSENCAGIPFETMPATSQGFNLDSRDQCGFKATGDKVNTDPLLLPLQDFGGPTKTIAPAAGSPIIDQGAAFGLTVDQHGAPRPIDLPQVPNSTAAGSDGSDIGAYELQPPSGLTLGKLTKNKKKGTATLSVTLPQPSAGTLTLKGKGLKSQTVAIAGQTTLKLKVAAKSKSIKKALKKKGKRKVKIDVTYTPTANTAATKSLKAKLVKKKKKRSKPKK
jgi:hypothetical protein